MHTIILNELGEELDIEGYGDGNNLVNFTYIGKHFLCRGSVEFFAVSTTYNVLQCRQCSLRINVPKEVDTYGKLRKWCAYEIEYYIRNNKARLENMSVFARSM